MRHGHFNGLQHLRLRLADTHTADGVTIKIHFDQRFCALLAQRGIVAALHDAENFLSVRARQRATLARPANGALDSEALLFRGRIVRRTFVKNHRDVGAKHALDFHGFFRADKQKRTIQVRTKFHAVFLHLANFCEAENLKAPAVGENRQLPIHELVQSAGSRDDFQAGPDVQVISVAEDDLRAALQKFARVHRLDAGLRADGHINRRVHDAVRGGQFAEPRFGRRVGFKKFKHRAQDKLNF